MKEAENLKQKLEEERQKLNDVTCKKFSQFTERKKKQLSRTFMIVYFSIFFLIFSIIHRRTIGND
jgi:hypothetical protein